MTTASGRFLVIDYDKDKARPYVKALLAKVNRLKEVKMLWFALFFLVLGILAQIALFFVLSFQVTELAKLVEKQKSTTLTTPATVSKEIRKIDGEIGQETLKEAVTESSTVSNRIFK